MCMELLQALGSATLPLSITDLTLIHRLRTLEAAGLVEAFIPPIHVDCDDHVRQDAALAIALTARGRRLLEQGGAQSVQSAQAARPAVVAQPRGAPISWWRRGRKLRAGA